MPTNAFASSAPFSAGPHDVVEPANCRESIDLFRQAVTGRSGANRNASSPGLNGPLPARMGAASAIGRPILGDPVRHRDWI